MTGRWAEQLWTFEPFELHHELDYCHYYLLPSFAPFTKLRGTKTRTQLRLRPKIRRLLALLYDKAGGRRGGWGSGSSVPTGRAGGEPGAKEPMGGDWDFRKGDSRVSVLEWPPSGFHLYGRTFAVIIRGGFVTFLAVIFSKSKLLSLVWARFVKG